MVHPGRDPTDPEGFLCNDPGACTVCGLLGELTSELKAKLRRLFQSDIRDMKHPKRVRIRYPKKEAPHAAH